MTSPRSLALWLLAATMLVAIAPSGTLTAQAPPPDVRYIRIDADDYVCQLINTTPTEAIPQQETTATYEPTPTATQAVFATPTHTAQAVPTQERATATAFPTAQTTPLSACSGRVLALEGLNVREQPNGARMGVLGYGANVDLFGYVWDTFGNKWYRVQWGEWAYVAASWIAPEAACWGLTGD